MTENLIFGAFWSYTHLDDEHENHRITRLRERLERSIRFFSGNRHFRIFQDRKDIGWGQKWAEKIVDSLDHTLLLFPVTTPSYLSSAACREELLAFGERQTRLMRDDLILPIYYLTSPLLEGADLAIDEPQQRDAAALLRARQHEDWRALRETPETDPVYAKAIERLAQKAVEALSRNREVERGGPAAKAPAASSTPQEHQQDEGSSTPAAENSSTARFGPYEPAAGHVITLTVNQMPGRADFTTITEAVARAPGGARLLISPGHYLESVVIDKPLELIGDGAREDIVVEGDGPEPLVFDTNIGVIRNLTLRQRQKNPADYCVWIKQGRLELEDCDLSSNGLACLAVVKNADPRVRRNRIHGGSRSGIHVYDGGRGTYEDNEVFGNAFAGISVSLGAEPIVRRNRIYDGKQGGIHIYDKGRGIYEDNEVFGNALSGISAKTGADPVVRRNRIYDGKQGGIHVSDEGRGTYEDNEVFGNALSGISAKTGADPVVRRNRIYDGKQAGIYVYDEGRGTYEDNDIFGNAFTGVSVKTGADPIVRRNRIYDGKQGGIYVYEQGRGTYEDNEVYANARAGVHVESGGNPIVRRNRIVGNGYEAIWVRGDGAGVFEDNDLQGNDRGAWDIAKSAEALVKRARNRES